MPDVVVSDSAVELGVEVVLRRVWQVDGGRNVDRLGIGVIREEVKVVRKGFPQADRAGIVNGEADRLYIKHKTETRIRRPAEDFFAARQSGTVCFYMSRAVAVDAGIYRQPHGVHPLVSQREVEVFAKLVFDFQTGLLRKWLGKILFGVTQRVLAQGARGRILAELHEVEEVRAQYPWEPY